MEKVLAEELRCDIFDELLSENRTNCFANFPCRSTKKIKSLASKIYYFDIKGNSFLLNSELTDRKTCQIAMALAKAIDNNSVSEIKRLKFEYGDSKEFLQAKNYLNTKCKEVWDVFADKGKRFAIPKEAMKALGITNQPTLEFLLGDSIKYYEKDNGTTTVDIILSILANENLSYTLEDIYSFLQKSYQKGESKFNLITVSYLASRLDYNYEKLAKIGVENKLYRQILVKLPIKEKLRCISLKLLEGLNYFRLKLA